MVVNVSMKFHDDILNGFQVTERTRADNCIDNVMPIVYEIVNNF